MNERHCTGEIATVAAGRRRWQGCTVAALVLGIMAASIVAAPAARSATLALHTGEQLDGTIVHATRNTVIVRLTDGMRQLGLTEIREIRVDVRDGRPVIGRLVGWVDGVYEIQAGNEVVWVTDEGRLIAAEAVPNPKDVPFTPPATPSPEAPPAQPPAPTEPRTPSF